MKPPTQTPGHDLPKELGKVSVVCITDPTAVGDLIEVLNMDVINLDPDRFEYQQVNVPLEECCLVYQWTTAALRTHSRVHEDFES